MFRCKCHGQAGDGLEPEWPTGRTQQEGQSDIATGQAGRLELLQQTHTPTHTQIHTEIHTHMHPKMAI